MVQAVNAEEEEDEDQVSSHHQQQQVEIPIELGSGWQQSNEPGMWQYCSNYIFAM